jgi:predicted protein tyrosine phosphatase
MAKITDTINYTWMTQPPRHSIPQEGNFRRWLFVDETGRIGSATAATMAASIGINARVVGTDFNNCLQPISPILINWAEKIIFLNQTSYDQAVALLNTSTYSNVLNTLQSKSQVLNIPSTFVYMEYGLQETIKQQMPDLTVIN